MSKKKSELFLNTPVAETAFNAGKQPIITAPVAEAPTAKPMPVAEPVEAKPTAEQEPVVTVDVIQKIAKEKKRPKKSSFSVYLGEENMKKLGAAAKKAGLSKSEFIDHLLSELL